ncbi:MAG TPA: hypothetical protein VF940_27070 [Streptosporangiaceae bacterium]
MIQQLLAAARLTDAERCWIDGTACRFPRNRGIPRYEHRPFVLGDCEIMVRGATGLVDAAPSLVAHYLAQHSYLPPSGFIEAVRWAAPGYSG